MLGGAELSITNASDPLDLAYARGWVSEEMHRTAMFLRALYGRTGVRGPDIKVQNLHEVDLAAPMRIENFSSLPDALVAELFDKVFCEEVPPADREMRAEEATELWGAVMFGLPAAVQAEVFWVCVRQSWPQWVIQRAAGKVVPPSFDARRERLEEGLREIRSRLNARRPPRPSKPVLQGDRPPTTKRLRSLDDERVRYVDEDGDEVVPVSESGAPFEIYHRGARRSARSE